MCGPLVCVPLLVWGQAVLGGGIDGLRPGGGETLILLATLLWAVEVVLAKRLLASLPPLTVGLTPHGARRAAAARRWAAVTGHAGQLAVLDAEQWTWALVTGALLAATSPPGMRPWRAPPRWTSPRYWSSAR
jgi:drug/metabolite transporter (DMT)-like permease